MSRLSPDQVEAFEAMAAAGRSVDELAAKFGLNPSSVRSRIVKLAASAARNQPPAELGPVKLLEARPFQCRFCIEPIDAPPHAGLLVCGKRVIDGKSWCWEHASIVCPGNDRRRIAAMDRRSGGAALAEDISDLQP